MGIMINIFKKNHGIVLACDVYEINDFRDLVKETCSLDFIVGYKIGIRLVLTHGIASILRIAQSYTKLPVIYDHQKFGTDIPEVCSGKILKILEKAGVSGLVVFPQAGINTLQAVVSGCKDSGITCIVGGEMTHIGYLAIEGGYICEDGPLRMYSDAAKLGVEHFVIPATRTNSMKKYVQRIKELVSDPKFLFSGIGKGQGADISDAFSVIGQNKSYAVVGRGIYNSENKKEAALKLWEQVCDSFKNE
jgi:orotidine-5'-phosphate decarboxylase